jgi:hypothetical protein
MRNPAIIDNQLRPPQATNQQGTSAPLQTIRKPITFNDVFKEGRDKNVPDSSGYYAQFVKLTSDVFTQAPKTPEQERLFNNFFTAAFTPGNRNWLANFNKDDKYFVFNRLSSPQVAKNIFDSAQKNDPNMGRMYTTYMMEEAKNQLFTQEIAQLNTIASSPRFNIIYNDKNFTMKAVPDPKALDTAGKTVNAVQLERAALERDRRLYQESLDNLGMMFRGLGNMATAAGKDPNIFIYEFMTNNGFNPQQIRPDQGTPLDKIGSAILQSQSAPQSPSGGRTAPKTEGGRSSTPPAAEPLQVPHFQAPEPTRSLEDWLKNPAGVEPQQSSGRRMPPNQNLGDVISVTTEDNPLGLSPKEFDRRKRK